MRYVGTIIRFSVILSVTIFFAQHKLSIAECPCDIYKTAETPCVAAYSTVRLLSSTYTGPLYQVRKSSDQSTMDIGAKTPGADQDAFLGTGAGTISKLYDQSGKGNDLIKAPKGGMSGTAGQPDNEANAKGKSFMINGHKAYALYINPVEGYRNNKPSGVATGNLPQGIYAVEDGSRANVGNACCFDFGTASTDNNAGARGAMNSLFFGICTYWNTGAGSGPWFMNDVEAGVSAGTAKNNNLPSSKFDYAFGVTKTNSNNMAILVANGTAAFGSTPKLVTAYNSSPPSTWKVPGGIILGIGGDNSNSSNGTFYEGVITAGRPSDAADSLVLLNVAKAGYGSTTKTLFSANNYLTPASLFKVRYNPSTANAVISYTLHDAGHMSMNIFDQQGRRIASIVDGVMPAGRHEAIWDAKQVPAGAYICRAAIDGVEGLTGKIIVQK